MRVHDFLTSKIILYGLPANDIIKNRDFHSDQLFAFRFLFNIFNHELSDTLFNIVTRRINW